MKIRLTLYRLALVLFFMAMVINAYPNEQITNLPVFYLSTDDGKPLTEKKEWKPGHLIVKSSEPSEELDIDTQIRGRGNSTWGMEKKPYRIKLDSKKNLLGLPAKEKNWVLFANYADKTLIRNAVAFKISELSGLEFTPSARFVDVVFNGRFDGNYMLTDQIEVNNHRVEVEKQEVNDTSGPRITGGYLLEIDGFADLSNDGFETDRNMRITIKYPKHDEINSQQRAYVIRYIKDFENCLFSSNFKHATLGYRAKVDTTSLINWYIACELTGNSDSFWSTYMYKRRLDDKLYFGPLWDYDIAFNNDNRLGDATYKLMREHAHDYRTWIDRFWQDEWFRNAVDRRWKELMEEDIISELTSYIRELAELLEESQQRNFQRWNIMNRRVYMETFLFDTYAQGIDYLSTYIVRRGAFLTESFAQNSQQPSVPFIPSNGDYYMIMNKQTKNVISVENALLNTWAPLSNDGSQLWEVMPQDNQYFRIVNKHSGLAMAGNGRNNNLKQVAVSDTDDTQSWKITPVGIGNIYGIENKSSGYSINNSGGSSSNGNPVIEWDNNIHLPEKVNQHWYFLKMEKSTPTDYNQNILFAELDLYPNPVKEFVYISISQPYPADVILSIHDVTGKQLYSTAYENLSEMRKIYVPVSGFGPGVYLVSLRTAKGKITTQKLIIH